jgi:hypothetical protein
VSIYIINWLNKLINVSHDSSIINSQYLLWWEDDHNNDSFLANMSSKSAGPSAFTLDLVLKYLLAYRASAGRDNYLYTCQKLLQEYGFRPLDSDWSCMPKPQVLQSLFELGAPVETRFWGRNVISIFMWAQDGPPHESLTIVEILRVLVECGADIHDTCSDGLTP